MESGLDTGTQHGHANEPQKTVRTHCGSSWLPLQTIVCILVLSSLVLVSQGDSFCQVKIRLMPNHGKMKKKEGGKEE